MYLECRVYAIEQQVFVFVEKDSKDLLVSDVLYSSLFFFTLLLFPLVACPTGYTQDGSPSPSPCSGHGICMNMAQLAATFTGTFLKEGITSYEDVWDAFKLQGCVCDEGYEGYDCSRKSCLTGANPRLYASDESEKGGDHGERVVFRCRADGGFFWLQYGQSMTPPLPYSTSPALLEQVLNDLPSLKLSVSVSGENETVLSVCGSISAVETTITLEVFPFLSSSLDKRFFSYLYLSVSLCISLYLSAFLASRQSFCQTFPPGYGLLG